MGRAIPPGTYRAMLYDVQGRLMRQQGFDPRFLTDLDVGAIPAGTYTLVVYRDGVPIQALQALKR